MPKKPVAAPKQTKTVPNATSTTKKSKGSAGKSYPGIHQQTHVSDSDD